ncbi:hypothetical protein SAMN05216304_109217 [Bosea sp. OK403]|nr:hypothetical protein SAMN05216304_109217 [Bosea sp. OK403]
MQRAIRALFLLTSVGGAGSAHAQSVDTFHGGALVNTFAAGVQATSSKRSNGDEILRIRANSDTAQPFIRTKLPASDAKDGRPYAFWLEIGPPAISLGKCGVGPESLSKWSDCFSTGNSQPLGPDLEFIELERLIPESLNLGIRFNKVPNVYARCAYHVPLKAMGSCEIFFEHGGLRHELMAPSGALKDIARFRCAAVQLRNAIWPDGPASSDICD